MKRVTQHQQVLDLDWFFLDLGSSLWLFDSSLATDYPEKKIKSPTSKPSKPRFKSK